MAASKIAYVLDFDGTVTERDITSALARHYGKGRYLECSAAYRRGEFGMKEWLERMSACLPPQREELLEFAADRAVLRPGFKEFLEFAGSRDRPVYIASDGFGIYIEPILEMHRCRGQITGIFRNRILPGGGRLRTLTPHAHASCPVCGNCKAAHVIELQKEGRRVIYVGDGSNDRFAAAYADGVFARDNLARSCTGAGVPFRRWDDYYELINCDNNMARRHDRIFCDPAGVGCNGGKPVLLSPEVRSDTDEKDSIRCCD